MTTTTELHAAIAEMQVLMKQAADVIEHNASSLGEAHTRNGIIEDREVQAAVESDTDLVAQLRAAALAWDQRQKPAQDVPEAKFGDMAAPAQEPSPTAGMNNDIRNLSKWLNEEQETPIDRQALARVLAMADQPQQEPVRCPQEIIDAITAYGDARADQDANNAPTTSHERLADCIRLMREALAEQTAQRQEPVGKAYLCDRCSTPFDGDDECPKCGHGSATKKPVYTSPQPAQREPVAEVKAKMTGGAA